VTVKQKRLLSSELSEAENREASLEGFEPTTRCLEGSRSILLSYRDSFTV
jgi:hypothetical protein